MGRRVVKLQISEEAGCQITIIYEPRGHRLRLGPASNQNASTVKRHCRAGNKNIRKTRLN